MQLGMSKFTKKRAASSWLGVIKKSYANINSPEVPKGRFSNVTTESYFLFAPISGKKTVSIPISGRKAQAW